MHAEQPFDSFQLHDDFIRHDEIDSILPARLPPFVNHGQLDLALERDATKT
jgi:hypothetical protein